ncbi:MAG: sulfurtransferase [Gammaproteobacteria bacterium]|nr:sulfurtransferase [Gammaproteobacteria bacterium]MBL6998398.1 sulfurtransferase [Gammaproteobacteria bacterium]
MKTKKIIIGLLLFGLAPLATASTPLVDVDWIKANSCNKNVRVLDIRNALDGGSKIDYLQGHIPCAVYTDYLKGGWRSMVNKVPGQLPPTDKIEKLIGDLGIDNKTHVVIYHAGKDALDMGSATRVYWTFKVLGHDDVSILNGGLSAYTADKKNPLDKGNNMPKALAFKAQLNSAMIATKEDVLKAREKGIELVDNRPADQFLGVNRHPKSSRNGTIPGAVNLPESWLTQNGGGSFRDVGTLNKLYSQAHVDPQQETINFCNTGHWASLGWFATSELMGNKNVKLYDGSMVEWTNDASLPMVSTIKF